MHKLLMTFGILLLITGVLSGIYAGGGGVVAVALAEDVTDTDVVLLVEDTTDYLSADVVTLGGEHIAYSSTNATAFLGCTRGYDDTTAASHAAGSMVYTMTANAVNNIFGFNIALTTESLGLLAVPVVLGSFFAITIPYLITLNINFLTGDLAILGAVFLISGGMFLITLALVVFGRR